MASSVQLSDFNFDLPRDRIARTPPKERDGGRLLVLNDPQPHQHVRDLAELLRPHDLLVMNDTRVLKARVAARRVSGGRVEALLLGPGPGPVDALLKPSKKLKVGEELLAGDGRIALEASLGEGRWRVRCDPEPMTLMAAQGALPLPPYFERDATRHDHDRYQTVFATQPGAVAAPTAGLHLTRALLADLSKRGVQQATVTLHVGLGTFRPVRASDIERGSLHVERYNVPQATADAVRACKARGGRVVAVGTTSCRTLEAAAGPDGVPQAGDGVTGLFIREGHRFRCIDGLLTNFHLPESSLLMLVCALGGRERVLSAYKEAIALGYRFYSYGDAMLLL